MSGKLFIVSAPSGAGKTSLVNEILTRLKPKYNIDRLVTYTSRDMRTGEKEGEDFCFISSQEFQERVQQGFFIEWSKEYKYYYGSPNCIKDHLLEGCSRILVIDRAGAKQILNKLSEAITIWICAPSIEVLRQRLLTRGLNSLEQVETRLELAKVEMAQELSNKFYKYHILNEDFNQAVTNLEKIFVKELKVF